MSACVKIFYVHQLVGKHTKVAVDINGKLYDFPIRKYAVEVDNDGGVLKLEMNLEDFELVQVEPEQLDELEVIGFERLACNQDVLKLERRAREEASASDA